MHVLKFGGTSVANAENIKQVVAIVEKYQQTEPVIVVVSASSGITDKLLHAVQTAAKGNIEYSTFLSEIEAHHKNLVEQLIPNNKQAEVDAIVQNICNELKDICHGIFLLKELSNKTSDRVVAFGELLSSQIIAAYFSALKISAGFKDSRELIKTNSNFSNALVDFDKSNNCIQQYFSSSKNQVTVLPGFIAQDAQGNTTTLGRGGSDYTAAIIAAALETKDVEIWTDVSGMMTADPRMVQNAKIIPQISFQEAMELSHFGAKVIYPPTLIPVMKKNINVWIKNTFAPADIGTKITNDTIESTSNIRGISSINKIALLSLEGSGMVGIPGFSKRLFEALSQAKINVILITQSSSEHSICVAIEESLARKAKDVIDETFAYEIEIGKVDPLIVETNLSIVALVGDNMKNHTGISGNMFSAIGKNGINIRAIAQGSSERNISTVIAYEDVKKALNVLHEAFFETSYKQINIFIVGLGNVGAKLIAQLQQQQEYLQTKMQLQLRVLGIANSKKMYFDDEGIDLNNYQNHLQEGDAMDIKNFATIIQNKNARNSVFVDVTANENIALHYELFLQKSISVVACNKVAASYQYDYYKKLKDTAREYNCQFLFETNVGAGLPVIATLNDLIRSGDRVQRIQAVLSGTLNFVFNHYDGKKLFAEVVKQAQDEGYTEPDPRLDLSGTDVMRKIMILARESGEHIEMDDIENESFLPASCMQGSVADFYKAMEKEEAHFKKIFEAAHVNGKKLKFVASYESQNGKTGKASVGLQQIDPQHDLYHLYGKDNIVLFYTIRYPEQPLVVKGAGAGAEVTASGVFADIMRVANQ
ncbi:MAG: bifunctional aspartate kinase/homoserine dehydrogenase I [Chitinophagaceae bacterium]|nr:bifunctional aspartate kinase/homoserine dehydrogenase I [Chitinophagaceae bacterium]